MESKLHSLASFVFGFISGAPVLFKGDPTWKQNTVYEMGRCQNARSTYKGQVLVLDSKAAASVLRDDGLLLH